MRKQHGRSCREQKNLSSSEEVIRQILLKFEIETTSIMEYNDVVSSLVEAHTQFLSAKYEYIFKTKVLSLYQNEFVF